MLAYIGFRRGSGAIDVIIPPSALVKPWIESSSTYVLWVSAVDDLWRARGAVVLRGAF